MNAPQPEPELFIPGFGFVVHSPFGLAAIFCVTVYGGQSSCIQDLLDYILISIVCSHSKKGLGSVAVVRGFGF